MKEHSEDICECGDYRKQHPENGAWNLNGLGHGMPFSEGRCEQFRLAYSHEANYEIYDEPWEIERDVDDERDSWGCVLGAQCLMPSYDHRASECYDVEMAEAWANEL
jgi:hypothetical protein